MPKDEKTADPTPETVTVEFKGQKFTFAQDSEDWESPTWIARVQATTTGLLVDWFKFAEQLVGVKKWERLTTTSSKRELKEFLGILLTTVAKECAL
ncbi:hypothetical protein [Mycolicibacterium fluoranthenivorans]|uniref:Uncharacterized protein n=1 Tax=Mycolicibacterium fluoranthenivorans TaxID=258505 RepID=A0A1G4VFK8_9MYCO|nr:hypothetical protein [Mycolicibacterium fluoranthenivorans]SCX06001.1 hypothetical protein SAMN02799620_00795 [Mycolicibacterium fluoranthenivorans]